MKKMRKQKSDRNEKGKSGERTKPESENARERERKMIKFNLHR